MNRNRWLIVLAVAVVLSAGLTYMVFRIVKQRLQPPEETTKIVVAAQKLSLGKGITKEDVKLEDWPKSFLPEGTFQDLETVLGRGVVATMYPGEVIMDVKLAPREGGSGLTSLIPDGKRGFAVKVNNVSGVAGFVLPGTSVDVILTGKPPNKKDEVSRIFLENVQVLTAGTNVEQDVNGKPENVAVVTLQVTPEEAQKLTLAGLDRIQLALRNPLDTEKKDPKATQRASLFVPEKKTDKAPTVKKSVKPRQTPVVAPKPPPPPENRVTTIEMIRGTGKETVTFTEKARQ